MIKLAIFSLFSLIFGFILGRFVYLPLLPPQEKFEQQVKQSDGSIIIERNPYEKPKNIVKPINSTLIRQQQIEIRPTGGDIKLDLSLIQTPDNTYRIIAKSTNGDILRAVDVPIDPLERRLAAKWGVGLIYQPKARGVFIERITTRFILGLDLLKENSLYGEDKFNYSLRVGYRF